MEEMHRKSSDVPYGWALMLRLPGAAALALAARAGADAERAAQTRTATSTAVRPRLAANAPGIWRFMMNP